MNADESTWLEEQFPLLLAAGDEALAAGAPPSVLSEGGTPADLRPRLERELAWCRLVRQLLPVGQVANLPGAAAGGQSAPPAAPAPDPVPQRLGRFEIRRELGRGAFGVVFLAYDPLLGRDVALKVPRTDVLVTPELRARFQQEARAAAGLNHPNLVPIYDAGQEGAVCFIASAYCPGVTLAAWLRERGGQVPDAVAARLVATLAGAVEHAHRRGVLHRDLKPSNVMLEGSVPLTPDPSPSEGRGETSGPLTPDPSPPRGEGGKVIPSPLGGEGRVRGRAPAGDGLGLVPRLTDFGLAKLVDGGRGTAADCQTQSGAIVGTPAYMAPEQAQGKTSEVGPLADVYALGAILYELLTGRPPFQGRTTLDTLAQVVACEPIPPRRLQAGVPADLETICLKCLQKEAGKRYGSAADLADDLHRFLKGEPIRARPVGAAERLARWCRRNPALAAASGLAAAALVGVAGLAVAFGLQQFAAAERSRTEQAQTQAALHKSELLAVRLTFDQGRTLCEEGRLSPGMLWLARSLEMAPDGADDLDRTIRANLGGWSRRLPTLRMVFPHRGEVYGAAFSPDGTVVLTGGEDRTAQLWDAATGRPLGAPIDHGGRVLGVAFAPDGKSFLTAGDDGGVRLWGTADGRPVGHALRHPDAVTAATFSRDGHLILTGCRDRTARLWDAVTGRPAGEPLAHDGAVLAVALSPDGKTVLTGSEDNTARLWDAATGRPVGTPLRHPGGVYAVTFSPDGRTLVTGATDRKARLWDAATGQAIGTPLVHGGQVDALAFSPDGRFLLVGTMENSAQLWEVSTGKPIGPPLQHLDHIGAVAFSPDGRTVLTASKDRTARLWELASPGPQEVVLGEAGVIDFAALSPDDRAVLTANTRQTVQLWDLATGKALGPPLVHEKPAFGIAFSPDSRAVLIGCHDGTARLWDPVAGRPLGPPLAHRASVGKVAISPDGRTLLTCGADRAVRLWDAETGQALGSPLPHPDNLICVAFSPDGRTVATGTGKTDQAARLWDAATGRQLGPPLQHQGWITSLAFGPDGRTVLSGSWDSTARLWEVPAGQPVGPPLPHPGPVTAAAFSPDGRAVLLGGADATARVWDLSTRKPLGPSLAHGGRVFAVAFGADGRTLRTVSREDSAARVWEAPVPVAGTKERVLLWAEVITGSELDPEQDAIRVLDPPTWHERRRRLDELGGPPLP